jgi:hypothetical protein
MGRFSNFLPGRFSGRRRSHFSSVSAGKSSFQSAFAVQYSLARNDLAGEFARF